MSVSKFVPGYMVKNGDVVPEGTVLERPGDGVRMLVHTEECFAFGWRVLVGPPEKKPDTIRTVVVEVRQRGVSARVRLHGDLTWCDEITAAEAAARADEDEAEDRAAMYDNEAGGDA